MSNTANLTVPNDHRSATVYLDNTTGGNNWHRYIDTTDGNWRYRDLTVEINPHFQADDFYVVPEVFTEPSFIPPPKSEEEVLKLMDETLEKLRAKPKEVPLPQKERGRLIERDDEE